MKKLKANKNPKVCILIVHRNGEKIIDNCLRSISMTKYSNFEVIVLLNGTEDNSEKIVRKYKVKIYKSEKNLGFAGGNNFLIKKSKSKYVIIMNDDVEVERDWINELVRFSERSNADICQPKVLSLKNKKMFEYAGASGGYIDKYGYPFCRGRVFDKVEKDYGQYDSPSRIFWACGSCMLIKRSLLDKIGGFDEDFFMYGEELDLCWRANLSGFKIYSVPSSKVYHLGSYSIKRARMEQEKEFMIHRNVLLVFLKNYSSSTIRRLIVQRVFLEIVSALAFPKKFFPVVKSLIWVVKNKKKIEKEHKEVQKLRKVEDSELQEIIFKKSIAYLYFIKGKDRFSELQF